MELKHFNRVAEIEVEDLVGIEDVHLGESSRFEEVADCGPDGANSARQTRCFGGGVSAAE
jgi:hypothetical protein